MTPDSLCRSRPPPRPRRLPQLQGRGHLRPNKSRLDSAFYEDLKRVCNTYSGATRSVCNGTARTYDPAAAAFGKSTLVDGTA
ncbi:phospholipase A2 [Catellatospora citrea]|uniref:phospholipase A2 n=1 Tax=Catellatospora citrea TaxID=53366 RepID=UPI003F4D22DA